MKPVISLFTLCCLTLVLGVSQSVQAAPAPSQQETADSGKQATDDQSDSGQSAESGQKPAEARTEAIRRFTRQLSGSSLVGQFTIDDAPAGKAMKPDRYQLATVNHTGGDTFLFVYVHKGVPIPLSLKVLWAGNTPVITLDDFTIIGMGTFSARVMFHGNRYAGTWQHGKKGGLMFGTIEEPARPGAAKPQPPAKEKPAADPDKAEK